MKKLTFSIALNLITDQFKRGASGVQGAFNKIKGSILGFAATLGIGTVGISKFINVSSEFEAAVSKLSAILGTTPQKIKGLTDNAKKLGETTKYTAAQATNLQIELAKLGFSRKEILLTTESVLKFAQATDAELAEAAALAGAALRMFGAEASESKRYVSAMAIATTKSALSFAYLRDALPTVGPVAKAFNFTIEDTLALLGKLADSGFDASSAATATRNILLNLANGDGALAKALGGSVKTLPALISGLQKLKEQGVDLNTTLQLTDKRSVAAFNAFLTSADKVMTLRESITGVESDLDSMANTMGDNVKGAFAGLASAWESILIKLSESTNGPLKDIIKWATQLLRDAKAGFAGIVAFIITLLSGKLLSSIAAFFSKYSSLITKTLSTAKIAEEQKLLATQKRIEAEKAHEATLTAYNTKENGKRLASKAQLAVKERQLQASILREEKAINNARLASQNAAAVKTTTIWGRAAVTIKLAMASVGTTVAAMWSAIWPIALISAIGYLIGKFINLRNEANRVKNIFSEYKKEIQSAGNTPEIIRLQVLQKLYNEATGNIKLQSEYQKRIEDLLGTQITKNQSINDIIRDRIKLLEATATADILTRKLAETKERNRILALDINLSDKDSNNQVEKLFKLYKKKDLSKEDRLNYYSSIEKEYRKNGIIGKYDVSKVDNAFKEYDQNAKILSDINSRLENTISSIVQEEVKSGKGGGTVTPSDELEKMEKKYADSLRELNVRRQVEKTSVDDYNKAYAELTKSSLIEALSSSDAGVRKSSFALKLAKEYSDAMLQVTSDTTKGLINEIEKITSEEAAKKIELSPTPVLGKRDTTFDYKLSESDKLYGDLSVWQKYTDNLRAAVADGADYLTTELNSAIEKVDSLDEALKIAQVKEDIKDLTKEINDGTYSGIKDIASSSDRVVNAFENIRDVFNNVDSSGWEKIMSVWNAMVNSIDALMSIIKTFETITELVDRLSKAKEAEAAIDTATTATKIANKSAETSAAIAALGVETSAETASSAVKTTAATTEMAAKSTAAYAYIPFAGVGLATAQIAAMQALITANAIPRFQGGGIISGGPYSGDKILARLNAGEMILNTNQQSNLFRAINSGKLGGASNTNVSIGVDKIRGADIYLSLKNYIKRTGKRL